MEADSCWKYFNCPEETRNECPAYTTNSGKECFYLAKDFCPKAKEDFKYYRNAVLKLPIKDFRDLQAGKVVDISKEKYEEYPHIYELNKEVNNGNKQDNTRER